VKKILSLLLVIGLAFSLAACGGGEGVDEDYRNNGIFEPINGQWPEHSDQGGQLPRPKAGTIGNVAFDTEDPRALSIKMNWTRDEAIAYAEEARDGRCFDQDVKETFAGKSKLIFEGTNGINYFLRVSTDEIYVIKQ